MKKQSQNEPDIVGLITKLQEQLAALDKKLDSLIHRPMPQPAVTGPAPKPVTPPPVHNHSQGNARPNDHHQGRQMYQATCADCKQACEIPFKPSGDRPVYCQECFRRRKAANNVKPLADHPSNDTTPAQTIISAASNVPVVLPKEKKKPAAARKAVAKRPVAKKKK